MFKGTTFVSGVSWDFQTDSFVGQRVKNHFVSGSFLESYTTEGDSPVRENEMTLESLPSTTEQVEVCGNLPEPSGKAKYSLVTDSEQVP
jgi:hypothetical protein